MTLSCYVTGATGCVGRNLVAELLRDGWDVTCLHRKTSVLTRLAGCNVQLQQVNLYDEKAVTSAIYHADAIFHCAANVSHYPADRKRQWKDNVLATRNLVHAALLSGVRRFIFTSTGATLGYSQTDAHWAHAIVNNYVRTKREAELEVYEAVDRGLDAVILQPIIVVGRYDWNNYSQLFKQVTRPLCIVPPGKIAFCHAADVARAHVEAYHRGRKYEHYVLGGTYTTWLDFYQRLAKVVKAEPRLYVASKRMLYCLACFSELLSVVTRKRALITRQLVGLIGGDMDVIHAESYKAEQQLRYKSRSLDVAIDDCYQWVQSA